MTIFAMYQLGFGMFLMLVYGSLIGEAYYNRTKFKAIVYNDNSNDDAVGMTTQQLIERSGYKYEEYFVIADDGYITNMIRVINPKADRSRLKQPPIMIYHGANIDTSIYLCSSSIQHHPEKWPRSAADGPITSYNRSLGFFLSNNGYDVWLIGQRGSNRDNQAYLDKSSIARARQNASFRPTEAMYEFVNTDAYWEYGLDEIITYDIAAQIDTVRRLTNSQEVQIFTFSLSTASTKAFLGTNPHYAKLVRTYVQMAPAISADHMTSWDKFYFEKLCPLLPTRGNGFTPTYLIKPAIKNTMMLLARSYKLRYTFVHEFITMMFGPSPQYQLNMELNALSRIFQSVSFKAVQHYCQHSIEKSLTMFDYGREKNLRIYGKEIPPGYQTNSLEVQNWVVISGTNDALADPSTVDRLIKTTKTRKPVEHVIVPGYNHADLLAAVEVDIYVNFPLLKILDSHSTIK